jgi:hypothetical protein
MTGEHWVRVCPPDLADPPDAYHDEVQFEAPITGAEFMRLQEALGRGGMQTGSYEREQVRPERSPQG